MNLDNFPFSEILEISNTEEELLENVENYFKKTTKLDDVKGMEGLVIESSPVGEYSLVPNVMRVYVALGKFSEETYQKIFPPAALTRKLRANWSLESSQDLAAVHNLDISDILAESIAAEITAEAEAKTK
jgi:hypothetical protein